VCSSDLFLYQTMNVIVFNFDLVACILFIKNVGSKYEGSTLTMNVLVSCFALFRLFQVMFAIVIVDRQYFALTMSFIVTSEYFHGMLNGLERRLDSNQVDVQQVLEKYEQLQKAFKKRNDSMTELLRNTVYFFVICLSVVFAMMFIVKNSIWVSLLCMGCFLCWLVILLPSTLYIGQVNARVLNLYIKLNSLAVRTDITDWNSFYWKQRLLLAIKELGSKQVNGQFVMGLCDGHGPPTSSLEIFDLTLETFSLTLMYIKILRRMKLVS